MVVEWVFALLISSVIGAPTYNASEIVYNMTDVYPLDVCWETMSQCHTIDSESFSPMPKDENKVFLEFSENTINGFCNWIEQSVSCSRIVEAQDGCENYSRGAPLDALEEIIQAACYGQGLQDLKTLLSCANTGHMQMDVFGRINEIAGRVRGMHECQDGSDNDNRMFSKMCWMLKSSSRSLTRSVRRNCGEESEKAITSLKARVADSLSQIVQFSIAPKTNETCDFLGNDGYNNFYYGYYGA